MTPLVKTSLLCLVSGLACYTFSTSIFAGAISVIGNDILVPVFFAAAVLVGLSGKHRLSVLKVVLLVIGYWIIYIAVFAAFFRTKLPDGAKLSSSMEQGIYYAFYALPGIVVIVYTGLLARMPVPLYSIVLSAVASVLGFLSLKWFFDDARHLSFGIIYLVWQTLVGLCIGLAATGKREAPTSHDI